MWSRRVRIVYFDERKSHNSFLYDPWFVMQVFLSFGSLQITGSRSFRGPLHYPVLYSEVYGCCWICRCHDLNFCHDGKNLPKQCCNCFGESRPPLSVWYAAETLGSWENREAQWSELVCAALYIPVPWGKLPSSNSVIDFKVNIYLI